MTTGILLIGGVVILGLVLLVFLSGIRVIPNTRIGIVEKRFSPKGSVKTGFIALSGEAGFQPHVLRGGIHYLTPFQYVVHTAPLVTIPPVLRFVMVPALMRVTLPPPDEIPLFTI